MRKLIQSTKNLAHINFNVLRQDTKNTFNSFYHTNLKVSQKLKCYKGETKSIKPKAYKMTSVRD